MAEFTHSFTCAACLQTFCETRSEAEANDEARELWGVEEASKRDDFVKVCDDCFRKYNPAEHPEEHAAALADLHIPKPHGVS